MSDLKRAFLKSHRIQECLEQRQLSWGKFHRGQGGAKKGGVPRRKTPKMRAAIVILMT